MLTSHRHLSFADGQTAGLSLIAGGFVFFGLALALLYAPASVAGIETYAGEWVGPSLVAGVCSLAAGFISVLFV